MCSGHAASMHWIDLEDQRCAGGMLLRCLGVLGGPLEVPRGPLGVSWEILGRPWKPCERPGIVLGAPGSILELLVDPCLRPVT